MLGNLPNTNQVVNLANAIYSNSMHFRIYVDTCSWCSYITLICQLSKKSALMIENLYLIRQSIPWARYLPNPSEWHWAGIAPSEGRMRFCFFSANQGDVLLVKGKIYWEDCSIYMMSYIQHEKNKRITKHFEWEGKVSCGLLKFRKIFDHVELEARIVKIFSNTPIP